LTIFKCKNCNSASNLSLINLGKHIPSNFYIPKSKKITDDLYLNLELMLCKKCFLVQIKTSQKGTSLFKNNYAYFSSFSKTWLKQCKDFVEDTVKEYKISKKDLVLEIASNDGYLLNYFKQKKIPCLGIEPTKSTAKVAISNNINVINKFFTYEESIKIKKKYQIPKLIIANNVIAHIDDIHDFIKGISNISNLHTIITIEFQHVLNLIKFNQFDTIYHEHFFYHSLFVLKSILFAHDLKVFRVKKINSHGGSLRLYVCKIGSNNVIEHSVYNMINREKKIGINKIIFYKSFADNVKKIKIDFNLFIKNEIKAKSKKLIAYGAAAKGSTFINYCNLNNSDIAFIIDKNPMKQNKLSPGGLIPIVDQKKILEFKPDYILILPWNIKNEIIKQLSFVKKWGAKFITAIPYIDIID
jgi:hypothetical protein